MAYGLKASSCDPLTQRYVYAVQYISVHTVADENFMKFADKVIRHNPPLPGLPVHALPVLNHDWTDHNTKPMEHWCILESCGARFLVPWPRIAPLSFAPTRTGPKNCTFYGPDPGPNRLYFPRTGPDRNNLASTRN